MTNRPVLEKCKMTPQEIFEYKRSWLEHSYQVDVHSDLDVQCKHWCRHNLNRWEWSMETYTDVYSHSFYFENDLHAKEFARKFEDWVDRGKGQ
jgi:hypothetical protein